jgi:hypothetical protein
MKFSIFLFVNHITLTKVDLGLDEAAIAENTIFYYYLLYLTDH